MNQSSHNQIVSFIWSIADDCLRDVYVRGKYRDVILPMVVLRRLDAILESTKEKVAKELKFQKEDLGFTEWEEKDLQKASGFPFYNISKWTMQLLSDTSINSKQIISANFKEYLDGYSPNVQEILDKFKLRTQIEHMIEKDVLLSVMEKFTSPRINLTPEPKEDPDGHILPALTNLGMGYVFEELIRKFNEENNEEAGEHFTPREVIKLMTNIVFVPIKDNMPTVSTIYDPACGSGGMLTESQKFIKDKSGKIKYDSDIYLYGEEINDETYAICKSDMMIKGGNPEHIKLGSTLSSDEFSYLKFDFMLSNPPYDKSWATDSKYIKDGKDVIDSRFRVNLKDYWGNIEEQDATPRSSDGQLLFLMEMVSKIKPLSMSKLGSRIASVHNGSSLFTGDAGGGESNIRRYIIENDLLDCIVQLPNNLFYNTGITTYIWFLTNNKENTHKGKVLLIDASKRFAKLRKNLGNKNCELTSQNIDEIQTAYTNFTNIKRENPEGLAAKVFDNKDFGYYKVSIERPARLKAQFTTERLADLRFDKNLIEPMKWAYKTHEENVYSDMDTLKEDIVEYCVKNDINLNSKKKKVLTSPVTWQKQKDLLGKATQIMSIVGNKVFNNFNEFNTLVSKAIKENNINLKPAEKNQILIAVSWYDEAADKVIKKIEKIKDDKLNKLLEHLGCTEDQLAHYGYYKTEKKNEYIIYETQSDLRDSENIPISENIHDYFLREVLPHVPEAWIGLDKTKIGYEISFNKYFYEHKTLRPIEEVTDEILQLEEENKGLINDILNLD